MTDNIDMKIAELVDEYKSAEFKWGVFDCCQFAAAAMLKIHGVAIHFDDYTSQSEARRVLRKMGGSFHSALEFAGMQKKPWHEVKRGDLVTFANDDKWQTAVGLVVGSVALAPSNVGLKSVNSMRWIEAWSVPCHK